MSRMQFLLYMHTVRYIMVEKGGPFLGDQMCLFLILTTTDPLSSRFRPQNRAGLSIPDIPLPSQLI